MKKTIQKKSQYSRVAAVFLCWLLGIFGAHYFYVGRTKMGLLQLFLTITVVGIFISSIIALIGLIQILVGSFTDKYGETLGEWK